MERSETEAMVAKRTEKAGTFPVRPTLRSPADELGPRARARIAQILEASKAIFLARGYDGTTIDDIAREAGVSRASFYTYFPTKRDVLLTLGADSARESDELIATLAALDEGWGRDDVHRFVDAYFAFLDDHGSFSLAWTQAAHHDDELRTAGQAGHLAICRSLGNAMAALRGEPYDDPTAVGLSWMSMLERVWSFCQLYDEIDAASVRREVGDALLRELGG